MRRFFHAFVLLAVFLAIPVLPVLVLGLSFEDDVAAWLQVDRSPGVHFLLIVLALAADIFLPIPSSAVSTYAGGSGLSFWPAVLASWLGMSAGAMIGFGLARWFGQPFVDRYAKGRDVEQMAAMSQRFGPLALLLTRALPILAEACVLWMGATGLSWRRFLLPVIAANLVISIIYVAFGLYFSDGAALPVAVIASGMIPLLAALLARRWLPAFSVNHTDNEAITDSTASDRR